MSCTVLVGVCCAASGVVLLFVRLGVLSDCGEGVSSLLVGLCFGVFLSLGGDCSLSIVNLFCVAVTVVWCAGVLSTLAYVCLEVVGGVVHVEVLGRVSVGFCVCFGEGVCVGVFLCVLGVFVEATADLVSKGQDHPVVLLYICSPSS